MVRRILMVMFVLLAVGSFVHVEGSKAKPERTLVKKEKLKHSKQAEVILEDVELSTFSDGMVSLQIQDSYHADNNPSAYDFEVDIKGLEYTTKNKDISNEKKMPNPDDTMALLPKIVLYRFS